MSMTVMVRREMGDGSRVGEAVCVCLPTLDTDRRVGHDLTAVSCLDCG